ncbi:DUF871 domain-containing protein [Texcoconibacillus texcoconensis]|uniref:Cell surface protein n=1 Tax=Texcoconibacillus texcoconensis TaxID=1095777 RepID=A0A840QLY1_9BACI|nr:MupG family TIM beta-alpha barrel fold protein [Texcoconibacillus texcoconensis]MBB5172351.1 hypothetical protein [Texcoconibacillus texcoconensis]
MRGFSIYLNQQPKEDQEAYIKKMTTHGFTSIFTSLHIPEDDPSLYVEALKNLGHIARMQEVELIADISPSSLSHLGFSFENAEGLLDWGITGLRADYGIDIKTIANLSHKMTIALNASTLTEEMLQQLVDVGLNTQQTEAWHNFYPRPETGIDDADLVNQNQLFKKYGLTTMAFVAGDRQKRGPLEMGLPTLEKHRGASPFTAAMELWRNLGVDKVSIGDPDLSEKNIYAFEALDDGIVTLSSQWVKQEDDETVRSLVQQVHRQRLDRARDVVRSETSRHYAQKGALIIEPNVCKDRPLGTITIDNKHYGRYQGELQITKRTLPKSAAVNTVGHISEEDLPLLNLTAPGEQFQLKFYQTKG